jgi:aldose 1-epimerase
VRRDEIGANVQLHDGDTGGRSRGALGASYAAAVPDGLERVTDGDIVVEVAPAIGARVHRLQAFGVDLLRTPPSVGRHRAEPFAWGGYLMAPWCNRAPARPFRIGSRLVDLEPNFPDGSAIHGLVHDRPWRREGAGAWRIDVPAGRWPWRHTVRVGYAIDGDRFAIDLVVENHDDAPMPAGAGWHPWFRAPVEVTIPASDVFESNLGSSAAPVPVHHDLDRREPGALAPGIDATWTGLTAREVTLSWPELGVGAVMSVSGPLQHVVAASPPELGAVAVEPQTHGPDVFRRLLAGETGSPRWLEPGSSLDARIELAFGRAHPAPPARR